MDDIKTGLAEQLTNQEHRLLVVIDDIDRLQPEEMRELFKLIKSVGNLPQVMYLLAFDEEVVTCGLDQTLGAHDARSPQGGAAYLEKLVQLPLRMPAADPGAVRSLLLDRLEVILGDSGNEPDEERWATLVIEGLNRLIVTPRHAVRLSNLIGITYPAVMGEVDIVDFVALQAVRLFAPAVYEKIIQDADKFALGHIDRVFDRQEAVREEFHRRWQDDLPDSVKHAIEDIICRLFPGVHNALRDSKVGFADEAAARERRASDPDYLPIYTRLDVPPDVLGQVEIQRILSASVNREDLKAKLIELKERKCADGSSRLSRMFEAIANTHESVPDAGVSRFVEVLLQEGDEFLLNEDRRKGLLGMGNLERMGRILFRLSKRLGREQFSGLVAAALESGASILIPVDQVYMLSREHGRHGRDATVPIEQQRLSEQQVKELEALAVERLAREAGQGRLLLAEEPAFLLYRWEEWCGDTNSPRLWIGETIADDHRFPRFLLAHEGVKTSYQGYRRVLDVTALETWEDPEHLRKRAQEVLESRGEELQADEKAAVERMARYLPDQVDSGLKNEYE